MAASTKNSFNIKTSKFKSKARHLLDESDTKFSPTNEALKRLPNDLDAGYDTDPIGDKPSHFQSTLQEMFNEGSIYEFGKLTVRNQRWGTSTAFNTNSSYIHQGSLF